MQKVSALGHNFDNDNMVCSCGVSWEQHQKDPKDCPTLKYCYHIKPKPNVSELNALRMALGVPIRSLARACGVSKSSAERVMLGRVGGGRGHASKAMSDRVVRYIRDRSGE